MMWIVASTKNIDFFKREIRKKILDIKFYSPKIKQKNKKEKYLLGNYLFCKSKHFDNKNLYFHFKFAKGLKKILFYDNLHNNDIASFINFCKSHEDDFGYIKNTFFKKKIYLKGKFTNGVFSNYVFNIIEKEKKKIKVLVGDIKISVSDKSFFNYSTI